LGQQLPLATAFTLRPGDGLLLLHQGRTRSIRGPGSFTFSGPPRGVASAGGRTHTGAVRGDGERTDGPSESFIICPGDKRCPR
jgi:hypothetical protein